LLLIYIVLHINFLLWSVINPANKLDPNGNAGGGIVTGFRAFFRECIVKPLRFF
jgi:hypothetical protein